VVSEWSLVDALGLRRSPHANASAYQVFVRDLVLPCSIGIHAYERDVRQRVRINADLDVFESGPFEGAGLDRVLNYEMIVKGINAIADASHIDLVETLAERIAQLCLEDRRVLHVRVRVEKLDVYPEAESVGVAIERWRDQEREAPW
jgi:7,8-dihydroneopterin aldolase/epimerase/oxygenase